MLNVRTMRSMLNFWTIWSMLNVRTMWFAWVPQALLLRSEGNVERSRAARQYEVDVEILDYLVDVEC